MIRMRKIHPHRDETYRYGFDDGDLVVSSGGESKAPKVWLSESMVRWIAEKGYKLLERHYRVRREL